MRFQVVPAAYVYLLRTRDGRDEVLLQQRHNTGYRDGHWAAGAAGHVEAGESVHAAARRETREELGVDAARIEPLTVLHRTDGTPDPIEQRVDFMFTAREWSGEPATQEHHKVADLRWFPLDALPDPLVPHERYVLEHLRAGDLAPVVALGFPETDPA